MYCAQYHDCNVMEKHCCSHESDVGTQTIFQINKLIIIKTSILIL